MPTKRRSTAERQDDTKKARTVNPTYGDADADVILVSADNVSFRVHRYSLQAASPVFRTMIQTGVTEELPGAQAAAQTVNFTDETLEHAAVIKHFLHIACDHPLPAFDIDTVLYDDAIDLIKFCDKYDCGPALRLIALAIEHPVNLEDRSYARFFYACVLDQVDAAHRIFPIAAGRTWVAGETPLEELPSEVNYPGESVLDMTAMSAAWQDRLPRRYFHALLRASRLRNTSPKGDWQDVADEFKRLLLLKAQPE